MKKIFGVFLVLVLCMLALTSCGFNPESTADVMAKIDKKMDSLKSYEAELTASLSTKVSYLDCEAEFTGKTIVINKKGEFYYYDTMDGVMKLGGMLTDQTVNTKQINAFYDGKMFVSNETDEPAQKQKFYSVLTEDEYIAYREKQGGDLDIDFEECVNKSFTKNEDKTWTLKYSGYTKKTIDQFMEAFGDDLFEDEITDMEIGIHANRDFTVRAMEIKMIFEKDSSFTVSMRYSAYNEATAITDTLNTADYKEIADCRILTDLEDMIEELEKAENGSFVLDIEQKVKIPELSYEETSTEKDTVSYGKKDGKYFYDITVSYPDGDIGISYENGKQTITYDGNSQTETQTEDAAIEFINGLINTANYKSSYVSNLEKLEEDVYKITCEAPVASEYEAMFEALGISYDSAKQIITVTIKDGKITKIVNEVVAKGSGKINYTNANVTIEVNSTNTFNR